MIIHPSEDGIKSVLLDNSDKINIEVSNIEIDLKGTFINVGSDERIEDFNIFNNIRDGGVKDYGYLSEIDT